MGEHPNPLDGLVPRGTAHHRPRNLRHFGDPATVLFLLDFNAQRHGCSLSDRCRV
jgi:hypothetical protein